MMLAEAGNPLSHVLDQPWTIGGHTVAWLSSQIAVLILAAALLLAAVLLLARGRGLGHVFIEAFVNFVRNQIARGWYFDRTSQPAHFLTDGLGVPAGLDHEANFGQSEIALEQTADLVRKVRLTDPDRLLHSRAVALEECLQVLSEVHRDADLIADHHTADSRWLTADRQFLSLTPAS